MVMIWDIISIILFLQVDRVCFNSPDSNGERESTLSEGSEVIEARASTFSTPCIKGVSKSHESLFTTRSTRGNDGDGGGNGDGEEEPNSQAENHR